MVADTTARSDLTSLVAQLADDKYFLGRRYAEWCTAAPTLESAVAAAAMAQVEIGHARSLYPLLRDVAGDSPEHVAETRTEFANADFLDEPFQSWTDFVAANFLFDTALAVLVESARQSSFNDLASRARRMLEEEPLHWLHGEGWTRRLARGGGTIRAALLDSFGRVAPDCTRLFGVARKSLIEDGVLDADPESLRERFTGRINSVLLSCELPAL